MEQQTEKPKRRPSIEVRCPKCGMQDFTYRKVGPSAKEGAR